VGFLKSFITDAIFYEGICVGKRRLDLLVDNKVLVELKAVAEIEKAFYSQVVNYLKVLNWKLDYY
jgi:GxxExxY protein